jgi:uncharacterized membrane protein
LTFIKRGPRQVRDPHGLTQVNTKTGRRDKIAQSRESAMSREEGTMDTPSQGRLTLATVSEDELNMRQALPIARIDIEAPWRWLAAGWADLWTAPHVSLLYGALFTACAAGLWIGLWAMGWQSLMLALAGGFLLVGPVLAMGLYEASRTIARGQPVRLGHVFTAAFRAPDQLALLGLALLLIYLAWVETAFLLFMMFFADQPFPPLADFVPRLLFTWQGVAMLIIGTLFGAGLAVVVFAVSAISAPMLMDRPAGVAAAVFTSARAVQLNPRPMALWAALIAALTALGFATLGVGLIVIFPWIGHATWHAYAELIGTE